ncbi:disulfide bond formation protein B [Marinobacterium rhizophilum]|uniref:Disulfide bond formation protein B n=1 Tax=Marinobacterium rhizophilum TaxID=420402 RepID=A0ABY5HP36_9GAMM|nr:disulfide bond formation protein B [Marinobacterium rhizophilum]UTW13884.1 disulfide bond formation protein B [Marinobacterium rhizophilum]
MSYRLSNFIGLSICAGALGFALIYLQQQLGLESCALCTLTRFIFLCLALLFAIGWVLNPRPWLQRLLSGLNLLLLLAGLATSLKHTWLNLTASPECVPETPPQVLSPMQSITEALRGGEACASGTEWGLFGLQVPHLTLLLFIVLLVLVWQQLRKKSRRSYFN